MVEFSVGSQIDASDSSTIPVVERVVEWVGDIKMGRDITGATLKTADKVEKAVVAEARHRNSDLFIAKQIKFHEKFLNLCEKTNFKDLKMPEPILVPVLKAVKGRRDEKKEELIQKGVNFGELCMNHPLPRPPLDEVLNGEEIEEIDDELLSESNSGRE